MSKAPELMSAKVREQFRTALEDDSLDDLKKVAAKYDIDRPLGILSKVWRKIFGRQAAAKNDINGPFSNEEWQGETLLEYAIRTDVPEYVSLLLQAGADFHKKHNDKDRSAVSIRRAARYAGFAVFKQLVDAGAPYEANDLLPWACRRGDPQVIQFLLDQGADPKLPEALGEAILGRHPELVKQLVELGADANKIFRSLVNFLPVTAATESRSPRSLECLTLVLDAGADPNAVAHRKHNFTALYGAAGNGSPEMIRRLIAAGADPNVMVLYDGPPLMHAIEENRLDNLVMLLKYGADPNLRCSEDDPPNIAGKNAVEYAKQQRRFHMLPYLEAAAAGGPIPELPAPTAGEILKKLKLALKEASLTRSVKLMPGASDEEIQAFESTMNISLPEEFKAWYGKVNGQGEGGDSIVFMDIYNEWPTLNVMSLDEIQRERASMTRMLADPAMSWDDTSYIPDNEARRSAWWHEHWIPIAGNFSGEFIIMDLTPTDDGIPGQIISYSHEEGPGGIQADSLLQWLDTVADLIGYS